MKSGIIEKYKDYLSISSKTPIVTLNEGDTPLIYSYFLSDVTGLDVYLKFEGLNPTGSFKDRGMSLAVSKAKEENSKCIICASTGNTAASAAAYGARGKIKTIVLIPDGYIAKGKLFQAYLYGAKVVKMSGNFDDALELVKEVSLKAPLTIVNSINPARIEGQKTAAFEIVDTLGDSPDYVFIPVGNAGNIVAYWKGFKEYKEKEKTKKLPEMYGIQAEGASPIVKGHPISNPQTIATAIRIGNPQSWQGALAAKEESKGDIKSVSDDEILHAYKILAKNEGIFVEPASAASVAGLLKYRKSLNLQKGVAVCILTGNGLKDPDTALSAIKEEEITLQAKVDEILKVIEEE